MNSSKIGPTVAKRNEKLVKLLDAIGDLPLASSEDGFAENTIDLFGDAYEYLLLKRCFPSRKVGAGDTANCATPTSAAATPPRHPA
ncbi:hypothetical protein [Sulfuritalea sp.]|uniref:hypothetical protein n=1 Tax=Sulfuritalea sp. TaxID=2480090 RepID=UPI001AD51CE6|nr:hypothetical protein [Sulfuritalea sp.]MBN8476922.1 hypothetical protein [Sulfuritalea sp.]